MKNTIPMIIAVVLAAAAVFAVMKLIKPKENGDKRHLVAVVCALKDIGANVEIKMDSLVKKEMDADSLPRMYMPWAKANLLVGQKANRAIASGDYVLKSDVAQLGSDIDRLIHDGEWAVPVTFADATLVQFLEPGMEIAILGTFDMKEVIESVDGTEKPKTISEEATSVIFPCVKILDIGTGDGIRHEGRRQGRGSVIVALTPQQAMTLVAAQRTMDLYPALRRRDDASTLKRGDVGVVNDATFQNLKKGLTTVDIPDRTER